MTSRERVQKAINFDQPDRTPRDFAAVPELWTKLQTHFDVSDRQSVLRCLGGDCRVVSYDTLCHHPDEDPSQVNMNASSERFSTGGMWRRVEPDGSNRDI